MRKLASAAAGFCALVLATSPALAQSTPDKIPGIGSAYPNANLHGGDKWTPIVDQWNALTAYKLDNAAGSAASNLKLNIQVFDPRYYGTGAKCDGSTDDYSAFAAAESAAQNAGGGTVLVPATGHACVISHGLNLANGVGLRGVKTSLFGGTNSALSVWTSAGSWLQSTDTVNPTVTMLGHGSSVMDVNFIRTQPTPSSTPGTPYTPTTYPFEILDNADFSTIENVRMIAVYNGLSLTYPAGAGGGTYVHMDHIGIDAMHTSFQTVNVNDTAHGGDIHARSMFYAGNSNLVTYREANAIGWDMQYTDNIMLDGYECFQTWKCITVTNGTVLGNTHAGYNVQLDKVFCGQVVQCIVVSTGAVFTGQINSFSAQQDSGLSSLMFDLSSDGVDLSIGNLLVPYAGGQLFVLGAGTGGKLKIGNLTLGSNASGSTTYGYSAVVSNQAAFALNAGARLAINAKSVLRPTTAGAFIGGAGADNVEMPTVCWTPFGAFGQVTVTGTGSAAGFTTDNYGRSNHYGNFLQVRLIGQPNVTVNTAGTALIGSTNFPTDMSGAAISCSYSTAATGFQSCDTNWKEVADTGLGIGRLNLNAPVGSTTTFGDITFCGR